MVLFSPAERCHVPILAQRPPALPLLEPCPQGRPKVGIGTAIAQEARETRFIRLSLAVVDPEVTLRDDCRKERRVATETVSIARSTSVGIHASIEKPLPDLQLVEVRGDV